MNELVMSDPNIALMQAAKQKVVQQQKMLEHDKTIDNIEKIEHAAQEFEAVFISEMLKPMFSEINEPDPLFGGGSGERVFNGMMVQEYGKIMADQGGIGIAESVKAELIKIQQSRQSEE